MGAALEIGVTQIGSRFGSSAGFNCSVLRQLWLPPAVFKHCRNDFFFLSKEKLFPYSVAGGASSGTNVTIPLPPARARCLPPPERKIQGVIRESLHVSHISPGFFGLLCVRDSSRSGEPLEQGVQSAAPRALSAFPRKSPAGPQSSALLTPAGLEFGPGLVGSPGVLGYPQLGKLRHGEAQSWEWGKAPSLKSSNC